MNKSKYKQCLLALIFPLSSTAVLADHPSSAFGVNQAGPLITIPVAALPTGKWSAALRTEHLSLSPLSDAVLEQAALDGEDIHSVDSLTTHYVSLAFGVTERLTVGLTLPYINREGIREGELHGATPEVHAHQDVNGRGDMTLLAQYQLASPQPAETTLGVLFGVQLATGDDQVTEGSKLFEAEFQPGSGTWHPMIGLAASKRIGDSNLDANLLYLHTREGTQETRIGALINYNIAWSYRFGSNAEETDHDHNDHQHLTWDAIIELNGELRDKNESHHHKETHSGGNLVYLSPGARVTIADKLSLYASIGIPVFDDANGTQPEVDYRTNMGLSLGF